MIEVRYDQCMAITRLMDDGCTRCGRRDGHLFPFAYGRDSVCLACATEAAPSRPPEPSPRRYIPSPDTDRMRADMRNALAAVRQRLEASRRYKRAGRP